jgi:hypothetical protein
MREASLIVQRLPRIGGTTDDYGNEVETYGPAEDVGVFEFDPGSSSEPRLPNQERVITEPALYAPFDTPFAETDKCIVDGVEYKVEGVPSRYRNRHAGKSPGAVVHLRRVSG